METSPQTTSLLPRDFAAAADAAWSLMQSAPGYISEREGRFLALAAAATPALGTILEIGSFKGKSTVGLASIAQHYNLGRIVAVDPFNAPSSTDPDLEGAQSSFSEFQRTLFQAGLQDQVEVHQMRSSELATNWTRPIRFLWIDGDHTYSGAKADLDAFSPWLSDGAIVAYHDALSPFAGPIRVFAEQVLPSDLFGPAGFVGSIAWAQYRPGQGAEPRFRDNRLKLARRAARLVPYVAAGTKLGRVRRMRYLLLRSVIPRTTVDPHEWVQQVRVL